MYEYIYMKRNRFRKKNSAKMFAICKFAVQIVRELCDEKVSAERIYFF